MTEAYETLLESAKTALPAVCYAGKRADLARAIRRIEAPVLPMTIWREGHWQFPAVNISVTRNGELAGKVLQTCDRTYATEIVQAWNTGNRRYAVSLLTAIRENNKRYAIRH